METKTQIQFKKDLPNKKVVVTRFFNAPVEQVYKAWTEAELLDAWWAPKPWKTETSTMNFKVGGSWLYSMVGPEGERHYCRVDYKAINKNQSFVCDDYFCDEKGNRNTELPNMHWNIEFHAMGTETKVVIDITFDSEADLNKIAEMGFQEGFTSALTNLDGLLEK